MFAISQNIMIQTKNSEKTTILPYFIISYPHREVKEKRWDIGRNTKTKKCDHTKHNRCLQYLQSAETYGKIRHINHQQFMQGVAP